MYTFDLCTFLDVYYTIMKKIILNISDISGPGIAIIAIYGFFLVGSNPSVDTWNLTQLVAPFRWIILFRSLDEIQELGKPLKF